MPDYRLTRAAENDLLLIAEYGDKHDGIAASDAYRDKLKKRFSTLTEKPLHYPSVEHIREGYRRSVCGVNSIYYRIDGDNIEIMRVLGRQDTQTAL